MKAMTRCVKKFASARDIEEVLKNQKVLGSPKTNIGKSALKAFARVVAAVEPFQQSFVSWQWAKKEAMNQTKSKDKKVHRSIVVNSAGQVGTGIRTW